MPIARGPEENGDAKLDAEGRPSHLLTTSEQLGLPVGFRPGHEEDASPAGTTCSRIEAEVRRRLRPLGFAWE